MTEQRRVQCVVLVTAEVASQLCWAQCCSASHQRRVRGGAHYDMFSIVLLLLSISLSPSQTSLNFTPKHPVFSTQHSDQVFAGAGGEAVLNCQVSPRPRPPSY